MHEIGWRAYSMRLGSMELAPSGRLASNQPSPAGALCWRLMQLKSRGKPTAGVKEHRMTGNSNFTSGLSRTKIRGFPEGSRGKTRPQPRDRKSTRLNSSHLGISYAVFCLKKKKKT